MCIIWLGVFFDSTNSQRKRSELYTIHYTVSILFSWKFEMVRKTCKNGIYLKIYIYTHIFSIKSMSQCKGVCLVIVQNMYDGEMLPRYERYWAAGKYHS